MIFKNINSEDISGLIICSEPPISSSAIRTKETTIDGRDGAIVEKLGYKTRIRNVEIGLKKDANVDKILSYFSGEGDLIFKNENDKVYKAAIYEQVDLERLLRLRKGSVAFYCQPFKYKRNDIFETIKDNKVKEKKGKHLELLNCAEQNVVDLKLEGSTNQATRSGKNLLDNTATTKISNGITFTVNSDGTVLADGTNDTTANSSLIINRYDLSPGTYVLNGCPSGGAINTYRLAIQETNSYSILGSIDIGNGSGEFTIDTTTNVQIAIFIQKGLTVNNLLFKPMLRKATIADDTYEQYGASPSPDYPAKIENVEGKNKFNKSNMTEATWDNGKTNTVTLLEDGRIQSTANFAQWAAKCIDIPNLKANTNYVVSGKIVSSTAGNAMIIVKGYKNNTLSNIIYRQYAVGTKFELSFNSSDYEKIGISLNGNNSTLETIYTTIFDEIQLEEGTVATPYVPYNSLAVKVTGKNFFDETQLLQANGWTVSNSIYSGLIDNWFSTFKKGFTGLTFKENTQYVLSFKGATTGGSPRVKVVYSDSTSSLINISGSTLTNYSYISISGKTISSIQADFGSGSTQTLSLTEFQIEEGTQATQYEPYKSQVVTFPLGEEKLMEGSYLADDGVHNVKKQVVFDGSEGWKDNYYDTYGFFYISLTDKAYGKTNLICSHFKTSENETKYSDVVNGRNNNTNICFYSNTSIATTLAEWKTYLAEQYANDTPVILEYDLAEPETVPYTAEQQEAYNQLQKLKLYKGQNTMFSLEGSIINLKYLEDTDEKVENQGNIYSKPIIRLEKTVFKEVEIAINGIRFKYNFEEDDYVEIDCEEMTVQYEGLDRNRRLVIDFEFPKLKEGNNDIVMYSGDCIIKCKRKDRWL